MATGAKGDGRSLSSFPPEMQRSSHGHRYMLQSPLFDSIRIRPLYSIRFVDSIPLFDSAMAAADDAHQARGANPMRLHRIARIPWQWAIKGGNWAGATSVDHPRLHNFRAALSGDSLTRLTPKLAREHA
jgi:hypothetical protein